MSYSFDLISHPDRTLAEHLESCNEISEKLLEFKYVLPEFLGKHEIEHIRKLLVYFHDFGKGTDFFQAKILDATEREGGTAFKDLHGNYINYFKQNKLFHVNEEMRLRGYLRLDNHAKMGAYWLFSTWSHEDPVIEVIVLRVVRRHHGHLTNFLESKGSEEKLQAELDASQGYSIEQLEKQMAYYSFEGYNKILEAQGWYVIPQKWVSIKQKFEDFEYFEKIDDMLSSNKSARYFLLQHYLFSLLLSADKGDMMIERHIDKASILKPKRLIPDNIVREYKMLSFKDKESNPIDAQREEAYQQIAKNCEAYGTGNFFSITLPTGFGKTFSTYNAAIILQKQFENQSDGKVPRIVYSLPFTSVIDQNDQILRSIFEKCGGDSINETWISRNHYLSLPNEKYDGEELINGAAEYLSEGWEQEVIVTTFVQLLEGIFTNRNRSLRKFHNMTNAIILLDEVQNVPPKYYEAIELVFKAMAEYFNTKFVFITATQPFLFENENDIVELTDPTKNLTKQYFEELKRIQLNQDLLKSNKYEENPFEGLVEGFSTDIANNPDKSFLFIFNTIAYSQAVYKKLKEQFSETHCLIYLSASILPKRRKQLIKFIMGKGKPRIVVATQVVEAGVDIDLDVVYRDLAPMDSINQAAGRCNRNARKGRGEVKLFNSGKGLSIYDGVLMDATVSILKSEKEIIPESNFYELNRRYASQVRKDKAQNANASAKLKEAIFKLNLEDLAESFKLIDKQYPQFNVFIPYSKRAIKAWQKYKVAAREKDTFKRKRAIKQVTPELLQFVTRFPASKYQPDPNHKDDFIIYENDWSNWYDLETGFKFDNKQESTAIF
jgi:CRISPR-associated endonuclease/helicase Cas3